MKERVTAALTWDGARWPREKLPARARAFLGQKRPLPRGGLPAALADGSVAEIRICWVPRLQGGADVLCGPFSTPDGRRLSYRLERTVSFGDVLGAVYRRAGR